MANMSLADLLQQPQVGQAPQGPQVPLSANLQAASQVGLPQGPQTAAPSPGVPTGTPQAGAMGGEEFLQKKTTWKNVLQNISKNPDSMTALLVLGHRLSKPRLPGETGNSRMAEALMQSRAQMGRSAALRDVLRAQKRKMVEDYLKQLIEQKKAESGRITANAAATNAETNRQKLSFTDAELRMKQREASAKVRKLNAEADRSANGDTLKERWAKITDRIQQDMAGFEEIDWDKLKEDFREANDLPPDYPLGLGGRETRPVGTGSPAPSVPSASPAPTSGPLLDPSKLQVGRVYGKGSGRRIWNPASDGDRDPRNPKNWTPIQ